LARYSFPRYSPYVSSEASQAKAPKLWKPHPDDADDVRKAMACADRGEFLSPAATEAFLRWMEGAGDESWRDELE
jgi:hypothetical protein